MGPVSSPGSIAMMLTPVSLSPDSIARCTGAAPRHRGRRDAWTLMQPNLGISSAAAGRIRPYATTTIKSAAKLRSTDCAPLDLSESGCQTGKSAVSAIFLTGDACSCFPRPARRSGCVNTETISWGLAINRSRCTAAKSGVPAKISFKDLFHPMMLANPLDEEKDFNSLKPDDFQAEYKWDGIRIQLMISSSSISLYSRNGEDISKTFPDVTDNTTGEVVIDGELLVGKNFKPSTFNDLQQRLNRKKTSIELIQKYPAFIRAYDILFYKGKDIRKLNLVERRRYLEKFCRQHTENKIDLSPIIQFDSWKDLENHKNNTMDEINEGVMIKLKDSKYLPGRKKGFWYKWKKNPKYVDAILMYAQRGHGKRSSYYSDYTFGIWKDKKLVPIGKAYSGYTDKELLKLDKFIRNNTLNKFGPVREVKKEIILEIAFDNVFPSGRHKSGVAMRFPRIHRIRWDKPISEVLTIEEFIKEFKVK